MSLIRVIASGPGGSPRGVGGTDIYQSTVDEDDGDGDDDDDEEEEDEHRLMNVIWQLESLECLCWAASISSKSKMNAVKQALAT